MPVPAHALPAWLLQSIIARVPEKGAPVRHSVRAVWQAVPAVPPNAVWNQAANLPMWAGVRPRAGVLRLHRLL